jgi:hypothetical protein
MNGFSDFFRSGYGRGAMLVVVVLLLTFIFRSGCHSHHEPAAIPASTNAATLQVTDQSGSIPAPLPPPAHVTNAPKPRVILSMDASLPLDTNTISDTFAPAGCSLKCVLVNSLESIHISTPVIGMVVEDLSFNHKLIVPRNTKVVGKAQVDRVRERLAADGAWTLVFTNGEELVVQGLALDCDVSPNGKHYGPDDGSAGFKGQLIKSAATWDEIKLFTSTFLSGMARSQERTAYTLYGPQIQNNLQNGFTAGTAAVLDEYARSIADTIKRDGLYVHVDGGSFFYLFLPQTLDRTAARIGATRHSN